MLNFSVNNTPASGAVALADLFLWAVAVSWRCLSSSNGAAGPTQDATYLTEAAFSMANAWFVVQQPGSTRQLCLQSSGNGRSFRAKYSPVVGFSFGTASASQVPAASDEIVFYGSGTNASPTYATLFDAASTFTTEYAVDDASPFGFFLVAYPTGSTTADNAKTVFALDPVVETWGTDADPYVILCAYSLHELGSTFSPGFCQLDGGPNSAAPIAWPRNWTADPIDGNDITLPVVYYVPGLYTKGVSTLLQWNTLTRPTPQLVSRVVDGDFVELGLCLLPWPVGTTLVP